jgi:predicted dehydrogenase
MLCDPDRQILNQRAQEFEQRYGRKVQTVTDLRQAIDSKEVDAISVATPHHWHTLAAIWGCQGGKDVYVEKPGAFTLFEGDRLVEAAHRYQRIVQHGVQLRSSKAIQEAVRLLRNGVIGNVYMARGIAYRWRPSIGKQPDEPAPTHLDWNLWQGPAQARPFSKRYVHYDWHWAWAYGNGEIGNQGTHQTDMCLWGLDVGLPTRITADGGKYLWDDDKETPEILTASFEYPEQKKRIEFEIRHWCTENGVGWDSGNVFYGSKGFMLVRGYDTFAVYFGRKREPGPTMRVEGEEEAHFANFIQAVRSRKTSDQTAPVETARAASALVHLANISYRLRRPVEYDPATGCFPNDSAANEMRSRAYRAPFVVPERV